MTRAVKVEMNIRSAMLKGGELTLPISTIKNIFSPYLAQEQFSVSVGSAYAVILPEVLGKSLTPPVSPYYEASLPPPPGWWDPNWSKRRAITVSGYHPSDYQLKIVLPFYDPSIRFLENANSGLLPYWVESYTANSMTVWVRRLENADNTIYVYYGNPSATSASDFGSVFPVFNDNAESGVLTDKWTKYVSGGTDSSGYSTEQARSGTKSIKVWNTGGAGNWSYVYKTFTATTSNRFVAWYYDTGDTSLTGIMGIYKDTNPTTFDPVADTGVVTSANSSYYCYLLDGDSSWTASSKARSVGWHKFQIDLAGGSVKVYIDDALVGSKATSSSARAFDLETGGGGSSDGFYADDVFIATLVTPEPTTSVGAEEQYGG